MQFEKFGDILQEERMKYINDKLSKLRVSEKLQTWNSNSVMMNCDGNSFYPSAMWDDKSAYLDKKSCHVLMPHMNDTFLEAFN